MKCAVLVMALVAVSGPASAQSIDLKKVWGDKHGCTNKDGQEEAFDQMLLLKDSNLVMAYSACEIKDVINGKNGSVTLRTRCDAEGEESDATFSIAPAKKTGSYIVTDEDGNLVGQVSLCR